MAIANPGLQLDPHLRSAEMQNIDDALRKKIVGQDDAVTAIVNLYQVFRAGLNTPDRPLGNLLFLGPTGAGKTHVVEATAEVLLGNPRAMIKVDCAEFQHSHEIAKLIGSPPGYVGHRETEPLITQEALAKHHTGELRISFLLFDEIEKASSTLWRLLLGVLDKGTLTLGDNRRVDLSQTMIFMTSNLGGSDMTTLLSEQIGFAPPAGAESRPRLYDKVESIAANAARKRFAPEFMNRIDRMVVFRPLEPEHLDHILQIELGVVQQRIFEKAKRPFAFRLTPAAQSFLLQEGISLAYGARHLRRAIERHLVFPIANLLATEQVLAEKTMLIDWRGRAKALTFLQESHGFLPNTSSHTVSMAENAPPS
jgi:ATP-dependent Clp protease ATP-binding subunit ClpB